MSDGVQIPSSLLQSILAPIFQPGANLQQTQAQIPLTQQEQATSQQSAATSGQEQQNLQAQNPGEQAQSTTQQVQATQNVATLAAGKAIKNGMTLQGAINTFGPLGAKADDIFQKYLASSPYGFPKESLTQLKNMGISDSALGQVGDLSSFADRQNMRNAIEELRSLQSTFNNTSTLAKLPFGNDFGSGKVYEGQRQLVGQHLSSLIQGAPHAAGSSDQLMSAIPDSGDISQLQSGEASQQFSKAEQTLLQSKGYTYKDLGLAAPSQLQTTKSSGGNILTGIMGSILNPQIDAANKAVGDTTAINNNVNTKGNLGASAAKALVETGVAGKDALSAVPSDISNALAIEGIKALPGGLSKILARGGESPTSGLPGAIKQAIVPSKAISQAGNVRDTLVQSAESAGKTINGNDVLDGIKSWAQKAKMGNLGQGKAVDRAVNEAESIFKDQTLNPTDALKAYKEADSGFTKSGVPKTPIQSNIDRGLRDVLSTELEKTVPGWRDATSNMAKSFKAAESPIRKGAVNLAKYGIPLLGAGEAGNLINHVLFGQ